MATEQVWRGRVPERNNFVRIPESQYQADIAAAEARGRQSTQAGSSSPAIATNIEAERAEGATAERMRIAGIDENTLPGHEKFAAACKADGTSLDRFVMAQLTLEKQRRGIAGPRSTAGAVATEARVFTAQELTDHVKQAKAQGRAIGPIEALAELRAADAGTSPEQQQLSRAELQQQMADNARAESENVQITVLKIRNHIAKARAEGRSIDLIAATRELELLGELKRQ